MEFNIIFKKSFNFESYEIVNNLAENVKPGSEGLKLFPYGMEQKECFIIKVLVKIFDRS